MFEDIMRKLGKCSKKELRRLITVYDASSLPNDKDDLETHITVALEVLWSSSNGNWTSLVDSVAAELDSTVRYLCEQHGHVLELTLSDNMSVNRRYKFLSFRL